MESILLGVVQGLTEFLPVSSSGHLVLTEKLLGFPSQDLRFAVVVHLGTVLAVVIAFRHRLARVVKGIFAGRVRFSKGQFRFPNEDTHLAWLLVLASLPAALAGILWGAMVEEHFLDPRRVGFCLLLTGGMLFATRFVRNRAGETTWRRAIVVGCAQAAAILPGISRSGSTIAAGIFSGIERERAAEFSFLLAVPIIVGAGAARVMDMITTGVASSELSGLLLGTVAAALTGYVAIKLLLRVIGRGHLHYFAYYCWAVGLAAVIGLK